MRFKKIFTLLAVSFFLISLSACSSNQVEPATEATKTETAASSKTDKATTENENTLPQPKLVQPSRGSGQSTGARISSYIFKTAVSAAITYFITKAIIDYVKKDVTGEE